MKILFFANTDWYLYNFRLPLACHLRDHGHEVIMLSPPGIYVARLQSAGFRALTVPMQRRSLNPMRELVLLNQIRRLYTQEHPDLVHHFTIKCVILGALAARLANISTRINSITGMGHIFTSVSLKARLLRPPIRALLRFALGGVHSRLIVQNPDDQAAVQQAGLIEPRHIRLIRSSGVDTKRFRPPERNSLQSALPPVEKPVEKKASNPLKILLASRLLWEKGVGEYVAAARQLRREGIAAEFWLAGDPDTGNPASIPAEQLAVWHQEGDVVLLGHVEDMPTLLVQTDVFVLPSSYGEGVPRSLIEAAACGLPLVATDVAGCREIVEHGVNGLLVPPKDVLALTDAIRYLYQNSEVRQRMGYAGRTKVIAEFDEQIVFEKTYAVYRELGFN